MTALSEKDFLKSPRMLSSNEHLDDNQLPGKFIKEHNLQTEPINNNICTREDTVFRYYRDTDTLSIYFAKSSAGVVFYSNEANNYILVSYDGDDKIISVEIYEASELLCCHLFETSETIDNKPPLSFYPICYKDRDEVEVFLVGSNSSPITFEKTEDKDFEVGMNDEKKIVTLLFHNASGRLAKTLPEEERKKLAKEARLSALEFQNILTDY